MNVELKTNAKLSKTFGAAAKYLIAGLTLAPNKLAGLGATVCPWATTGCIGACNLWFSGQRVTPQARECAIRYTRWLFDGANLAGRQPIPADYNPEFIAQLHTAINRHRSKAKRIGLQPLVRLNVASDLDWTDVIAAHPDVAFYDYTKSARRMRKYLRGLLPRNYALTFSQSEHTHPLTLQSFLRAGGNVARVVDTPYHPQSGQIGPIPDRVAIGSKVYPTIDGDKHDVRLPDVDGFGVVVCLRLKGTNAAKARARHHGFALPVLGGAA